MRLPIINDILFLLVVLTAALRVEAATCKDKELNQAKLQLVKDSIIRAKMFYPNCSDKDEGKDECSTKDKAYAYLDVALGLLKEARGGEVDGKKCPVCPDPDILGDNQPIDCTDILKRGNKKSGVYMIWPKSRINGTKSISVFCDMDTDGGGWTVIQRRGNYSLQTDFYQDWETYKQGFGHLQKDFWLGNEKIFTLTNQGVYSIRFDLKDKEGVYKYSLHSAFWIGDEQSNYVLHVHNFTGTVTDNFILQDGMKFSTKDRQNDKRAPNDACADKHRGAWWYRSDPPDCGHLNLNGMYMPGINDVKSTWWWDWTNYVGLFSIEMKIRQRYPNMN